MAARTNRPNHDEKTRQKIQASQLINRLQDHIFGTVEMSPTQVRSAEILLKKTLPDLASVEQSINPNSVDALQELFGLVRNRTRSIPKND